MKTIAITGKGGTGKTTLAALLLRGLASQGQPALLAVDADANVNLHELLGVSLPGTIGAIREEMKAAVNNLPAGMTKQQFLEYKVQSCLAETPEFDLLAMGRPEGPGCYCYANNLLRDILASVGRNYDYIVMDNEAGLEHLSRRTAMAIDYLLMVSTPHVRGIKTAGKISRLVEELQTTVNRKYLVLNRVEGPLTPELNRLISSEGLELLCSFPECPALAGLDQTTEPLWPDIPGLAVWPQVGEGLAKMGMRNAVFSEERRGP